MAKEHVGTAKPPKAPKEKKPKEPKVSIVYTSLPQAKPLLDDEKRLKAVPTDFDHAKMESLKKGDFASEHLYLEWKAQACDFRAAELTQKATELRRDAENQRKFGDPAMRSKVKRHQKLLDKLKELQAELQAAGALPTAEAAAATS